VTESLLILVLSGQLAGPARQPVDFSHRRHAERGMQCAFCHPTARKAEAAGLPDAALCLGCHRGLEPESALARSLSRYDEAREPIPWVRICRLPGYVFFGHDRHAGASVACAACHGPVAERDVLAREGNISMKACVACHKAKRAPTRCNACHEIDR
jgi:hypothetical protein